MLATTDITEGGGENVVSENETLDAGLEKAMGELVRRAQDGDESVMPAVHKLLDEVPVVVEQLGNLAEIARGKLLKLSSDGNLLRREAQSRWMKELAERIAGPNPSILERLLAEQIVMAGMQLHLFEAVFAQEADTPLRVGDYLQRCIDRAQKRYLQAIKTLAQIRKLGLPALQVNIAAEGGKQVNVT